MWSFLLDRRVPAAPRYLLDLSAVTPDLEPIPVMETPHILKSLLDTLFSNDELKMWQIYEEHSGNICVKLRFNGRELGLNVNVLQSTRQGTFKRRSAAQTKRDRERASHHQMKTRSQRQAADEEDTETAQEMPRIEVARSGDFTRANLKK